METLFNKIHSSEEDCSEVVTIGWLERNVESQLRELSHISDGVRESVYETLIEESREAFESGADEEAIVGANQVMINLIRMGVISGDSTRIVDEAYERGVYETRDFVDFIESNFSSYVFDMKEFLGAAGR